MSASFTYTWQCDLCSDTKVLDNYSELPSTWRQGWVEFKNERYNKSGNPERSFRVIICPTCWLNSFDGSSFAHSLSAPTKELQKPWWKKFFAPRPSRQLFEDLK